MAKRHEVQKNKIVLIIDEQFREAVEARGSWYICKTYGYILHSQRIHGTKKQNCIRLNRLIWELANGPIPEKMQVDHIDRNRQNNLLSNLRLVTNQQNSYNTGAKGYSWDKNNNKWIVWIQYDGKQKYLGRFVNEEDARQAYLDAKKIYHVS